MSLGNQNEQHLIQGIRFMYIDHKAINFYQAINGCILIPIALCCRSIMETFSAILYWSITECVDSRRYALGATQLTIFRHLHPGVPILVSCSFWRLIITGVNGKNWLFGVICWGAYQFLNVYIPRGLGPCWLTWERRLPQEPRVIYE